MDHTRAPEVAKPEHHKCSGKAHFQDDNRTDIRGTVIGANGSVTMDRTAVQTAMSSEERMKESEPYDHRPADLEAVVKCAMTMHD